MSDLPHLKRIKKEIVSYNTTLKTQSQSTMWQQDYFYYPDCDDVSVGYALIIGPTDTPYENGFYCIKMKYPDQYPFVPPECTFLTLSGIRQSPNLYENGKVCLSVIGTWGEKTWKSTMGFHTVIMSIISHVLVKNAIDCEPPYNRSQDEKTKTEAYAYEEIVRFANFKYNTYQMHDTPPVPLEVKNLMQEDIMSIIKLRSTWYIKSLEHLLELHTNKIFSCSVYETTKSIITDYKSVLSNFINFAKINSIPITLTLTSTLTSTLDVKVNHDSGSKCDIETKEKIGGDSVPNKKIQIKINKQPQIINKKLNININPKFNSDTNSNSNK